MFGRKPKPKNSQYPDRPEAFQWADLVNVAEGGSERQRQIWEQAYRNGIYLDFDMDMEDPYPTRFYPEFAENDYTFFNPNV